MFDHGRRGALPAKPVDQSGFMSAATDMGTMSSIKDMSFTRDMYIMSPMKDTNLRTAEQLGAAIRLKRKEKDLTQSELAKLLGAERKWVINLESGNSKAEIGLVLRALEALNLRASITDGDKPKTRGTLREASPLDEVFRNLQQTSRK